MDQETDLLQDDDEGEGDSHAPRFASDGSLLPEARVARSGLSLDGKPSSGGTSPRLTTPSKPLPEVDPKALLQDGAKRAKNITTALAMVVVLLLKYFAVKVVGGQLKVVQSKTIVLLARLLQALYIVGKPHFEKLKVQARETTNQLKRTVLLALIAILMPIENVTLNTVKSAKEHSAKLAAQGVRTTVQVLRPIAQAIVTMMKAGFQKATVQKVVLRLIQILEEAQK